MKKIAIIFCLCSMILSGCSAVDTSIPKKDMDFESTDNAKPNIELNENVANLDTSNLPQIEGIGGQAETALDGKHHEMYYAVDMAFIDHFVGVDEYYNHYYPRFGNTVDNTYRGICEYYGITKAEYIDFWEGVREEYNASHLAERWSFEEMYPLETLYDEWFSDDYETNPVFYSYAYKESIANQISSEKLDISTKSTSYLSDERSANYTHRYYTIDSELIDSVGADEFNKYISCTSEINIISFIEYFKITKEKYLEIYDGYKLYPYNPDYLFARDDISSYFCVESKNNITK